MINEKQDLVPFIESQFPAFYSEEGKIFIEFAKMYYRYLSEFHPNATAENDDIDLTFEEYLVLYQKKFLADVPIEDNNDIRFIIKHIQDLYRRKGTEESIRLFFNLIFDEEIELFYPSGSVLRPSDSKYSSKNFIEFLPVFTTKNYLLSKGDRIVGNTSKSSGIIDELIFKNINGAIVPVAYMSNLYDLI